MGKVFIDSEYNCHTNNPDGIFREIVDPFFDDKCQTFIEGYKYVPVGESWISPNGEVFTGVITNWKPYSELYSAQREYEKQLLAEYKSALAESVPLSDLTAAYQEGVNAAYDQ